MPSATRTGPAGTDPDLLSAIDQLYAAAGAELSWDRPVEAICRLAAFDACTLVSVGRPDRRPFVLSAQGRRPFAAGVPTILPANPLLTDRVLESAPGALWCDHDAISAAVLETTSFWRDWLEPNRFAHWGALIVGKRDAQVVCLEIYSSADRPLFTPDARHLLTRLAPHLCRAWRLSEALGTPAVAPVVPAGFADEDLGIAGRLRAEYGLTRAEVRLALALAEGRSPAQVAELFERKLTTIRSQLQQLFAKTGTSRQAELVAMLLARSEPARPEPAAPRP